MECSLGGKEKLRGCDYRLAAVIVAHYLRGKSCVHTQEIIIIIILFIQHDCIFNTIVTMFYITVNWSELNGVCISSKLQSDNDSAPKII